MAQKKLNRTQKHVRKLLDAFSEAAQAHGWEQDQGAGKSVSDAEAGFDETKKSLLKYLDKKLT